MALQESVESCSVDAPPQHQVLVAKPRRVPARKLNDWASAAGGSFLEEALALIIWFLDFLGNSYNLTAYRTLETAPGKVEVHLHFDVTIRIYIVT